MNDDYLQYKAEQIGKNEWIEKASKLFIEATEFDQSVWNSKGYDAIYEALKNGQLDVPKKDKHD